MVTISISPEHKLEPVHYPDNGKYDTGKTCRRDILFNKLNSSYTQKMSFF